MYEGIEILVGHSNLSCTYCKKPGHHINNCFSRKAAEARKSNDEKPKTTNFVSQESKIVQSGNGKPLEQTKSRTVVRAKDL